MLTIIVGAFLGLVAMGLVTAGVSLLVVDNVNRDDSGYLGLGTRTYVTSGYAITSEQFRLDSSVTGSSWLDTMIGRVRVSVTSNEADKQVFVGIARAGAARDYLRGVDRLVVGNLDVAGLHARNLAGCSSARRCWLPSRCGAPPARMTQHRSGRPIQHESGERAPTAPEQGVGLTASTTPRTIAVKESTALRSLSSNRKIAA